MAFSWFLKKQRREPAGDGHENSSQDVAATICLRVEQGLLMAFGPDGDPMPPSLVKSVCADDPKGTLQLESGKTVDRHCVLNVLDAQQKAPLTEKPSDGWVEAMLCLGGAFEPTASELLDKEPLGMVPALPDDDEASANRTAHETEIITPLAFDEAEQRSMAKADALLVNGLETGVSLSAGRYDPAIDGWVVRLSELTSLAIQRSESAAKTAEINVAAIALRENAKRWPIATKRIELA